MPQSKKQLVAKAHPNLREAIKNVQDSLASTDFLRRQDLGELLARRYARECLEGIMNIARDEEVDPAVRMVGYKTIWEMGHGKPASVIRIPDPNPSPALDEDIRRAEAASEALGELEKWGDRPPEEWPPHLRKLVGGMVEGEVVVEGEVTSETPEEPTLPTPLPSAQ